MRPDLPAPHEDPATSAARPRLRPWHLTLAALAADVLIAGTGWLLYELRAATHGFAETGTTAAAAVLTPAAVSGLFLQLVVGRRAVLAAILAGECGLILGAWTILLVAPNLTHDAARALAWGAMTAAIAATNTALRLHGPALLAQTRRHVPEPHEASRNDR